MEVSPCRGTIPHHHDTTHGICIRQHPNRGQALTNAEDISDY
jgi:hypothetical protein